MSKRVAIHTLGCKVNQYDSEAIVTQFQDRGYEVIDFRQPGADVYVINTCTVTNISDQKSRQMIRKALRSNPDAIVVVVGCLAQTDPDQIEAIDGVNLIVGTNDRKRIAELVEDLTTEDQNSLVKDIFQVREFEELDVVSFEGRTRAFLKIQDGCNQFCSYCKVPYARGPSRSRQKHNVISQAEEIVAAGYREIVLTGVHLGAYGRDLNPASSLTEIVRELTKIDDIARIRISSIDPNEIEQELIDLVANNSRVCRHLHIPLQSGSDQILSAMRRPYNCADFSEIVARLRQAVPEIAITTDVIVGFPGETDALFAETYAFLKESQVSGMHVFKYSPRQGTRAAEFPNQVEGPVKDKRSHELISLSQVLAEKYHCQFENQSVQVLVERVEEGNLIGHTDNYLHVAAPVANYSEADLVGNIVEVKIIAGNQQPLAGILV